MWAAENVFLSQPAVSNALSRLRTQLDDELFVKGPGGWLRSTPRALELAPSLDTILSDLKLVLEPQEFDPAAADLSLTIAPINYFSIVAVPHFMRLLAREVPGIRICISPLVHGLFADLDRGAIDVAGPAFISSVSAQGPWSLPRPIWSRRRRRYC